MVNHNQATVTEFMLCTWPQIIMVRLFLQLIEKMDLPQNVPPTELPQKIESSPQPPTPPPPHPHHHHRNFRKHSPHYHILLEILVLSL